MCDSIMDEVSEETGLQAFKQGQMAVLKQIADIITTKKKLEEQEAELKVKLKEAMEKYNIKKFESDILTLLMLLKALKPALTVQNLKRNILKLLLNVPRVLKHQLM